MLATQWSEVVATTTAEYLKGAADVTIRDNPVFAMLQRRKRIEFGQSGAELRWQVKFSLPEVEVYTGGALDFAPSDKHRQLVIDWRGYKVTDMMTERERLENRGAQALIDRYARVFPDMEQSLTDRFGTELYIDGNTYTDRFSGLETFLGDDAATAAGDICAKPSDTYGGYSTVPGALGGAWTTALSTSPSAQVATDWPSGSGDPEYDWHSPRLINWSSTGWGTGGTTWIENCERALRRATLWTQTLSGKAGKLDLYLMTPDLYYDYLNRAASLRSVIVPAKEMIELGFDGVQQEGIQLTHEFGVPANTCYGLNLSKMTLHMMYDSLFISKGPQYDMRTDSWLFLLATYGNWRWHSPKHFCKLYNYA
jgi:hypothetical protein